MTIFPSLANAQDTVVLAKHLDIVEEPNLPVSAWKAISSPVAQQILSAVGWTELRAGIQLIKSLGLISFEDRGEEHKGAIQSPNGYSVCHAKVENPSVNCGGTFAGSYRTWDDPANGGVDGLHYYIVVPQPGAFSGRCWSEGIILITFVPAYRRSQFNCAPTGTVAFYIQ